MIRLTCIVVATVWAAQASAKGEATLPAALTDLTTFATERAKVEAEIVADQSGRYTRADLLVMLGRSSAACGDFALSAAACVMFLKEFGAAHPDSEQVATRLVDSLAPFNLDSVDIQHTADGPRYQPAWRMNHEPRPERLRLAIAACEYATGIATEARVRGEMFLRLGWVQRALNDWPAATAAWERCATHAHGLPVALVGLRLAAENQRWTGHPQQAAELLKRVLHEATAGDDQKAATRRDIQSLEFEARRDASWLREPVASLEAEVKQRHSRSAPNDVYREVITWLSQRGEQPARLAVARWGMAQKDWPLPARLAAHADTADTLLAVTPTTDAAKTEAATVFAELIELAPDDGWLARAAIRRSTLLRELGRAPDALAMWKGVVTKIREPGLSAARVLSERIKVLVAVRDRDAARLLDELTQQHPDYSELSALRALVDTQSREGKR